LATLSVFEGPRVRLRPAAEPDLPKLMEWDNDPEITRWAGKRFDKYEEAREWYLSRANIRKTFVIEVDGRVIGEIEIINISWRLHTGEMRIFIGDKSLWNRGLGEESVRALVNGLFKTTSLEEVFLRVNKANRRARRCYEKVGFKPEGRLGTSDGDIILMTIRRSDLRSDLRSPWEPVEGGQPAEARLRTGRRGDGLPAFVLHDAPSSHCES